MDVRNKEHRKGSGASVSFALILTGIVCSSWRKKYYYPLQGAIKLVTTLFSWIHTCPWNQMLRHFTDDTAKLWSVKLRKGVMTW